jgi:D-alanyl-D-alanine dipeptidase
MMSNWEEQKKNIEAHEFDIWSKKLMESPFIFSDWECSQVGEENEGPYRQAYQELEIADNGEALVPCADWGLVSSDYYLGVLLDDPINNTRMAQTFLSKRLLFPFAWVRESIAKRLSKADKTLRNHGMFLVVRSGWRDGEIQTTARGLMKNEYGEDYIKKAVAEYKPGSLTPHITGGACDIELWSLQTGQSLSYSYPGDLISAFVLERKKPANEEETEKRKIRRILYHLLASPGLVLSEKEIMKVHPGEYWHFGDGDPLSAFLRGEKIAKFGYARPPENYKYHNRSWGE